MVDRCWRSSRSRARRTVGGRGKGDAQGVGGKSQRNIAVANSSGTIGTPAESCAPLSRSATEAAISSLAKL